MNRSGYSDELDQRELAMWRGQVAAVIRGKRGQAFIRELIAALEAMPNRSLIAYDLQNPEGEVCALGALGAARGLDMQELDPEDYDRVARAFRIGHQLVQEIEYQNDDVYLGWDCTTKRPVEEMPEARWTRMHSWLQGLLRETQTVPPAPAVQASPDA